jgi:hypothetical protein
VTDGGGGGGGKTAVDDFSSLISRLQRPPSPLPTTTARHMMPTVNSLCQKDQNRDVMTKVKVTPTLFVQSIAMSAA